MNARLLLLVLCAPAGALADVELKYNDGSGFLVSDGRVLFADNNHSVLYEPDRNGLVVLDNEKKTWMEIDNDAVKSAASNAEQQMEQALAGLTPEQRAMVERQMPELKKKAEAEAPAFKVTRTGNRHEVAGYDCSEAEISGGQPGSEEIVCIASANELGIADSDYQTMIEFMDNLSSLAAMSPNGDPVIEFAALEGVPIRSESVARGEVSELVEVDTDDIDPSRMAIPESYTKISMGAMMQQ